jgi:hypothetical protein
MGDGTIYIIYLFARFANDRAAYIQGKDDFVKELVQRAIAQS